MSADKPRVWIKPFGDNFYDYTLLDASAVPDVLTAKRALELARPGLEVDFFHVFFMGVSKPRDDSYGIAAFKDEENMFEHAPGSRNIFLRVARVPLSSAEFALAMKGVASCAHLLARPTCAPATPKVACESFGCGMQVVWEPLASHSLPARAFCRFTICAAGRLRHRGSITQHATPETAPEAEAMYIRASAAGGSPGEKKVCGKAE